MNVADELMSLMTAAAKESGKTLKSEMVAVAQYAADRAAYLSTLVGQKGFEEAVLAERDNVALLGGIRSVAAADAADAKMLGIIQAVLQVGARAIATA